MNRLFSFLLIISLNIILITCPRHIKKSKNQNSKTQNNPSIPPKKNQPYIDDYDDDPSDIFEGPLSNDIVKFLECLTKNAKFNNKDLLKLFLLITNINNGTGDLLSLSQLLLENFQNILPCINMGDLPKFSNGLPLIDYDKFYKMRYDWEKYLKCIVDKSLEVGMKMEEEMRKKNNKSLEDLVNKIKEGKYQEALKEEFVLRENGNKIVKECIPEKVLEELEEDFDE